MIYLKIKIKQFKSRQVGVYIRNGKKTNYIKFQHKLWNYNQKEKDFQLSQIPKEFTETWWPHQVSLVAMRKP